MIRSVKVNAGYAKKLPAFKRKINFGPGLNILFGPNGCGKSTLIQILAAYTGVDKQGWSGFVTPHTFFRNADIKNQYPEIFKALSPGNCGANVEWNGYPTFCFDGVPVGQQALSVDEIGDTFLSVTEGLSEIFNKPSAGLRIITRINRIPEILKNAPDITQHSRGYEGHNDLWRAREDMFIEYVKSIRTCKGDQTITVLLDEADRSLSIPNQKLLWRKFIPDLAKYYQVIAATHSPFSLHQDTANYIEMEKGYLIACREAFQDIRFTTNKKDTR